MTGAVVSVPEVARQAVGASYGLSGAVGRGAGLENAGGLDCGKSCHSGLRGVWLGGVLKTVFFLSSYLYRYKGVCFLTTQGVFLRFILGSCKCVMRKQKKEKRR